MKRIISIILLFIPCSIWAQLSGHYYYCQPIFMGSCIDVFFQQNGRFQYDEKSDDIHIEENGYYIVRGSYLTLYFDHDTTSFSKRRLLAKDDDCCRLFFNVYDTRTHQSVRGIDISLIYVNTRKNLTTNNRGECKIILKNIDFPIKVRLFKNSDSSMYIANTKIDSPGNYKVTTKAANIYFSSGYDSVRYFFRNYNDSLSLKKDGIESIFKKTQ